MKRILQISSQKLLLVLFALILMPIGAWGDGYFVINTTPGGGTWVSDTSGDEYNVNDILGDGTMSYDVRNNVLTLNGIDLTLSDNDGAGFIAMVDADYQSLTIQLIGENHLTLENYAHFFYGSNITFTTNALDPGSLTITTSNNWTGNLFVGYYSDENINVSYNDNLCLSHTDGQDTYTIQREEKYNLWIGEIQVTSINSDAIQEADPNNITGSVSFDPSTSTLTLNNATIRTWIKSSLGDLTINLQGTNKVGSVVNDEPALSSTTDGKLTLKITEGDASLYLESYGVYSAVEGFTQLDYTTYGFSVDPSDALYNEVEADDGNKYILYTIEDNEVMWLSAATFYTGQLYPIWVGGTQVSDVNKTNILDDNIQEGTVSYNPDTQTLTLENVNINMSDDDICAVRSSLENLKVNLVGSNTISLDYSFYGDQICFAEYSGEAGGRPEITFETEEFMDGVFYALGSLTLNGVTSQRGSITSGYTISNTLVESPLYIDPDYADDISSGWKKSYDYDGNVQIWMFEAYDLWIGSGRVISTALEGGQSGGPIYNPITHTLLAQESFSYPIRSKLEELIISIDGNIELTPSYDNVSAITYIGEGNGKLKFVKAEYADLASLTLGVVGSEDKAISGFRTQDITIEEPLQLVTPASMDDILNAATVTIANYREVYDITIAGTTVTDVNAEDIFGDGTVSYNYKTNTLTLNNATIPLDNDDDGIREAAGIDYMGTTDLTISLIGDNTIQGGGGCEAIRYNHYGDERPKLTFTKGDNQPCTLQLEAIETTVISAGFDEIVGINGIGETTGNDLSLISEEEEVSYDNEFYVGLSVWDSKEEMYIPVSSALIKAIYNIGVTFGNRHWATYCAPANLAVPEGLDAYIVKGVSGREVTVEQVRYLPKDMGVLLYKAGQSQAEVEQYTTYGYEDEATTYTGNMLVVATTDTSVSSLTTASTSIYVLYNDGFTRATTGTISAGRCFLPVGTVMDVNVGSRLSILIDDTVNGIAEMRDDELEMRNGDEGTGNVIYDLQGRIVPRLQSAGIYIKNGKKIVIK